MRFTKKAMVWFLMLTLALLVPGALAELADGIYEATASGVNGDITVHVAVMGGEIVKITADHSESAEVGAPAIDELIRRVMDVQDPDVDIVTGASQTSEAFVEAMKAALTQAGWEEENFEWEIIQRWTPSPEPTPEPTPVPVAEVSAPQISFTNADSEADGVAIVSASIVEIGWVVEGKVKGYHLDIIGADSAVVKSIDISDTQYTLMRDALSEGEVYTATVIAIPQNGTLEANGVAASAQFILQAVPTPVPSLEPVSRPMLHNDILRGDWYTNEYVSYVLGNKEIKRSDIRAIEFVDSLDGADGDAWDVSEAGDGSVLAWVNSGKLTIAGKDGVTAPTDASRLFARYDNLESIAFNGCFYTGETKYMGEMFAYCKSLPSLDVSGFDTSNVEDMVGMFESCRLLSYLDVSGFDTSKTWRLDSMFCNCQNLTSLDVSGFDTGNVRDMFSMFQGCSGLTELDVSGFDTSNVEEMANMFELCTNLTNLDVSGFDTRKVTWMSRMFGRCKNLTSLDVSGFVTWNLTSMRGMFEGCSSLMSLDVSGFDTQNVANMCGMFSGCSSLTSLDVSGFDTSNVTDMSWMFNDCSSLTSLDVSNFDTHNVEDMSLMFYGCINLKDLDTSGFDMSKVTKKDDMF